MNYPHWSERRASSIAPRGSAAQVSGPDLRASERHRFRGSPKGLLTLLVVLAASTFGGCSNNAAKTSPSSSSSQTPVISVAMTQNPPSFMVTGTSTQVSAVVNNDAANAGVDWVVTCGSTNCGSFSPTHTAAAANTTFTAPPGVPAKSTLTIMALSTTDHSKFASATVSIGSNVTGIVILSQPPASIPAAAFVNFNAEVFGDPAHLGVDWTATCTIPGGTTDCSTGFSGKSGSSIVFTVPQVIAVPGTAQQVSLVGTPITITAFPTADHKWFAQFTFTVTAPISISFTQPPPATLLTNGTAQVIAVVANDTLNDGVAWSVACAGSGCGSITPQTGSGGTATYTAPPSVPTPSTVTITALAMATGLGLAPQQATVTFNIAEPISVSITKNINNNTIIQNVSAPVIATVSNDTANAGVDWTVTCGSAGACGTFAPAHTASGAATTYTAPSAPPTGSTVTITATSTADPTKSDQQVVTVTSAPPPNSLLTGPFVLFLSGKNSQNGPFVLGGVISGNGNSNGLITEGRFDLADAAGNAAPDTLFHIDPSSTSTYSIGPDGRGQIQLILNTHGLSPLNFGVPIAGTTDSTLTLSVVFVTPQHALLVETDAFGDGTGTLDLQNPTDLASFGNGTAGLNGTYSLQLTGTQFIPSIQGFFVAAAITSQAVGDNYTFTGFTADQSANGVIKTVQFTAGSQSFPNSAPLPTGEIQLSGLNLGLPTTFSLDLWLIDANHFVVTDFIDPENGNPILIGGYLTIQPASPSLSGTLAFTEAGATMAAQPQVAGGLLTCGSSGTLDVIPLAGTPVSESVSATCSAPANGRGLIAISGASALNSSGTSQFAAYPTLDQGVYLIELDGTSGSSGAGVAFQQTLSTPISSSALSGNYGSVFSAATALGSQNFTAQIISDGVSRLSGNADVNSFNTTAPAAATPSPGTSLSGSSFTTAPNGRFPLTLMLTPASGLPNPQIPVLHPVCYVIDANTCLLLGLDATAPGTGILLLQNTTL